MWNFCDDGGNHPASCKTLKMEVFPGDDFSVDQIGQMIAEMVDNGLIVEYQGFDSKKYWHVTGWHHQKFEKPSFKYPKFDDQSSTGRRLVDPVKGKGKVYNNKKEKETREGAGFFEEEEGEKEENKKAPQVAPPPHDEHDHLHTVRVWCAQHLDELRKMASRAGYNEQHGMVSDQVTLFCSHFALDSDYQNAPLEFFRAKFTGWLTKAKQIADAKPKRSDRQPRQSRKADAAPKETPPPPGGYTAEFVTAAFRSRYGAELCERLTNNQITRLTQATSTEHLSQWMEGYYNSMKNGKQQGRTGLVSIGSTLPTQ